MKKLTLLIITVSFLISGCASGPPKMAIPESVQITSVSINPQVTIPEEVYYLGPGFGVGMLFGAVGAAVSTAKDIPSKDKIAAYAKQHGIDIGEIMHAAFIETLQKSQKYPVDNNATNRIALNINLYGLSIPHGFSGKLVPILVVTGEMQDQSNTVIWRAKESVLALGGPSEPVKLEQIENDPDVLRLLWTQAAQQVASELVDKM